MSAEFYQQVKTVFRQALEVPPGERECFLKERCATSESLLTEVLALLEADGQPQTSLDRPAVGSQFHLRLQSLSYSNCRG